MNYKSIYKSFVILKNCIKFSIFFLLLVSYVHWIFSLHMRIEDFEDFPVRILHDLHSEVCALKVPVLQF